jgi:hypothetical protein
MLVISIFDAVVFFLPTPGALRRVAYITSRIPDLAKMEDVVILQWADELSVGVIRIDSLL